MRLSVRPEAGGRCVIGVLSICLLCLLMVVAGAAWSDDAAIRAVGGSVAAMDEHPTIHLTAEYVHARFDSSEVVVECVFFLENRGAATDVTIGFPNLSAGADVERIVPFTVFRSYVDADSAVITIRPDSEHQSYGDYVGWYTKTVHFAEGQRRCIRDVYTAHLGYSAPRGVPTWFDYVLWSGSSWAGRIEVADVVFTFASPDGLPDMDRVKPRGFLASGGEIRWHFTDLEPIRGSEDGLIHVEWN